MQHEDNAITMHYHLNNALYNALFTSQAHCSRAAAMQGTNVYNLLFRGKAPEDATRVPLCQCHGNVHQFVQEPIEEDKGGAHFEEA